MINLVLTFVCILGFIYQVYLVFNQYMLGKTVINIEVKRLITQPLPAITFCIPTLLSILKLSKLYQRFYQDYKQLLNITKANNTYAK